MIDRATVRAALDASVGQPGLGAPAVLHIAVDQELALLEQLGWLEFERLCESIDRRIASLLVDRTVDSAALGEWSAILAPGPPPGSALRSLAALVQRSLSGLVTCGEAEVFVSVTVGASPVAHVDGDGDEVIDVERALIAARSGCRDAQSRGGNRAVVADRFDVDAGYDADLTAALVRAIDDGDIAAHYQPVVDLATGAVVGVEALARWQLADGSFVAPDRFVECAERAGLSGALDARLLERVTEDHAGLHRAIGTGFALAVNVSPLRLVERQLLVDMHRLAEVSAAASGTLVAEITESALLTDPLTARAVLDRLAGAGVRVALDDFGTGISSLSHLRDFPVDIVKVDRSFVDGVATDPATEGLVAAVVTAGRALDCTIIAEGVETDAQAACLRRLGAQLAQGYRWAPAVPMEALSATLDAMSVGELRQSVPA